VLTLLGVSGELLGLVDDNEFAGVARQRRAQATRGERLVARGEPVGGGGEGGGEGLDLVLAVDAQVDGGVAGELNRLAVGHQKVGPGHGAGGADEAMQGGAFPALRFAGDDEPHIIGFF
jgi:hypothetical protein